MKKLLLMFIMVLGFTFANAQSTKPTVYDDGAFEVSIGTKLMTQELEKYYDYEANLNINFLELGLVYNINRHFAVGYSYSMASYDYGYIDNNYDIKGNEIYFKASPFVFVYNEDKSLMKPFISIGYLQNIVEDDYNNLNRYSNMTASIGVEILLENTITFGICYKNDNIGNISNQTETDEEYKYNGIAFRIGYLF